MFRDEGPQSLVDVGIDFEILVAGRENAPGPHVFGRFKHFAQVVKISALTGRAAGVDGFESGQSLAWTRCGLTGALGILVCGIYRLVLL